MPKPADVLDLTSWKLTLPLEAAKNGKGTGKVREVLPAELADFDLDPYFLPVADGVRFRAPVVGFTTPNSKNVRAELREMKAGKPTELASWSSTDSTGHTCWVDVTPTRLPTGNEGCGLVIEQIHDKDDDVAVWRIEPTGLWLAIGDKRSGWKLINPRYKVGTRLIVALVAASGEIRAYYNGMQVHRFKASISGAYFRAGAYTQANAGAVPKAESNFGEAIIHSLRVIHGPVPVIPGPSLPPKPPQTPTTGSVTIIRHGEKPTDPDSHELSEAGRARAQALVGYFRDTPPTFIFASKGSTASDRMVQTAQPLAAELGITVDSRYDSERQVDETARLLADRALAGETVLAVLEHSCIPDVASDLAEMMGSPQPRDDWPDEDYSSVWVLESGQWRYTDQGATSPPTNDDASRWRLVLEQVISQLQKLLKS